MHTSTVTVSVTDGNAVTDPRFSQRKDDDFRIDFFNSGKGGQNVNKNMNNCRMIHIPTGISEIRKGRSRDKNITEAKAAILKRLDNCADSEKSQNINDIKSSQTGSGMRGDKRRTYRFQDDQVKDHITNKSTTVKKFMRGYISDLW